MSLFFREIGSGPPVIILHGLFGSSNNWLAIAKELAADYRIILPDLRNHGQSFHDDTFDYKSMSDDLLTFIEGNNIVDPVVLGHSLGGKVAMTFAVNHPSMLKKLVVVDIGPHAYPVQHQQILEGLNSLDLTHMKSRKEADDMLSGYVAEAGIRQFLLKNLNRNGDGGFGWALNLPALTRGIENVGKPLIWENTFSKPVLFIKGGRSGYIENRNLRLINEIFTDNRLVSINGAGHWVHAEKPAEFISTVRMFLAK